MGLLGRLFNIGKSEANSALDKMEDPIKMTEQAIRDMKSKSQDVITAQAQSKANLNKLKTRQSEFKATEADFLKKAHALKEKVVSGKIDKETGEKAIIAALNKVENAKRSAESLQAQIDQSQKSSDKITENVAKFRKSIDEAENNLITLKARAKSADANKAINKQLSDVDVDGYKSTLQRMEDKVAATEAEADAYEEINNENKSEEDIINEALAGSSETADSDLLASFMSEEKAKA